MIGAIGASSWATYASLRPAAVGGGDPIQPVRRSVVFEVAPVPRITDQTPTFTGYGANGRSGGSGASGQVVDRSV